MTYFVKVVEDLRITAHEAAVYKVMPAQATASPLTASTGTVVIQTAYQKSLAEEQKCCWGQIFTYRHTEEMIRAT